MFLNLLTCLRFHWLLVAFACEPFSKGIENRCIEFSMNPNVITSFHRTFCMKWNEIVWRSKIMTIESYHSTKATAKRQKTHTHKQQQQRMNTMMKKAKNQETKSCKEHKEKHRKILYLVVIPKQMEMNLLEIHTHTHTQTARGIHKPNS